MALTTTIAGLSAVTAPNLTDAAVIPCDDALGNTVKTTVAQLRTQVLSAIPSIAVTGAATIGTTLAVTGTATFTAPLVVNGGVKSATSASNVLGSALTTTATDGFLYLPTCAGTPTGVPTVQSGAVALVMDTVNSKLWYYTGAAWKGVVLA